MKIVLAPDSFKGSLSASEVCDAMTKGILKILPDAEIDRMPIADGGEGTVQTLVDAMGGSVEKARVTGPLGKTVTAKYGLLDGGQTAVIEMASASGLSLVPEKKRNPLKTTTYGTGELIRHALGKGCRKIVVGIGGSATTDCGTGMAQALGIRFIGSNGQEIRDFMCGELMGQVTDIHFDGLSKMAVECEIVAACDVDNTLLGEKGTVRVYSRQKGADEFQLERLEANMKHIIDLIERKINRHIRDIPGAGAAGGLGAGLIAFIDATLESGVELVLKTYHFAEHVRDADFIFTGEGQIDFQTAFGKTISGVASEARKQSVPVIAIVGAIEGDMDLLYDLGMTSVFSIYPGPMSLTKARHQAASLIEDCTERIMRIIRINPSRR